ncbi:MAG: hypothetical protein IJF82_08340 [Achromobacter sp.]|uniref:hypothetical protein n=1 Tax=Achromobacter dolens TaxID=1287738 RepID=UPI0013C29EAB|nr:hypothetical protein [Achromobacter dolens]MBQ2647371.1 hypothetical protein [Achromobacter sp.]
MTKTHQPPHAGGIDPAALIVAAVVLLGTTMLGSGSFSMLSTILGATIGVLIYAYDASSVRNCMQQIGFSMVIGLAATVSFGAPAEWIGLLQAAPSEECLKNTQATCHSCAVAAARSIEVTLATMWIAFSLLALVCESERTRSRRPVDN